MTPWQKAVLAVAVTVLVAMGWFFRWEITSVAGGEGAGRAYMLNRWTGAVYFVNGYRMSEVEIVK